MTELPNEQRLLLAMDLTWAPAQIQTTGPWTFRAGKGGGKRVSAATCDVPVNEADILAAEKEMRRLNGSEIFMLRGENDQLDHMLDKRGYRVVDPVVLFAADTECLAEFSTDPHDAIPSSEPLAIMQEIWKQGGISQPRIDVMRRTNSPKTYLFSRHKQTPSGVAFIAVENNIAMLHALEVAPDLRRYGVARRLMGRAAIWAKNEGAEFLAVAVTSENLPACRLYTSLGMQVVGKYHYRMK